jgi:hypothetical protein
VVFSRTSDEGIYNFNDENAHSDGKTSSLILHLGRSLVEGGGFMLGFLDDNIEIDLQLDSSSLMHVRSSLLEGLV